MNTANLKRITLRHPYLFSLVLLVILLAVNWYLQPNLLERRVLGGNLRNFLPLMILAVGQTIVIIGGGIDLSVGTMVSMVNAILVTLITREAGGGEMATGIALALAAGMAAGLLNGLAVAYLRLQPIVTTYATGFIFAGIALAVLPRPGGLLPPSMTDAYRAMPLGLSVAIWAGAVILLAWAALRGTRYGRYLFAVGGKPESAFATGVPVSLVRLSTYVLCGLMAAFSAIALTMNSGTGNPRSGDAMTLPSIVAVVVGGTRLSGGQGGIFGSLIGVVILFTIKNIISFANVPTWYQTLVDALIIVIALAAPGLIRFIRNRRAQL